jgi:hypothetical protein
MKRAMLLVLTLLAVAGAVVTSVPRAEAASCGWRCVCHQALCVCPGGPPACGEPRPDCSQVPCAPICGC